MPRLDGVKPRLDTSKLRSRKNDFHRRSTQGSLRPGHGQPKHAPAASKAARACSACFHGGSTSWFASSAVSFAFLFSAEVFSRNRRNHHSLSITRISLSCGKKSLWI